MDLGQFYSRLGGTFIAALGMGGCNRLGKVSLEVDIGFLPLGQEGMEAARSASVVQRFLVYCHVLYDSALKRIKERLKFIEMTNYWLGHWKVLSFLLLLFV